MSKGDAVASAECKRNKNVKYHMNIKELEYLSKKELEPYEQKITEAKENLNKVREKVGYISPVEEKGRFNKGKVQELRTAENKFKNAEQGLKNAKLGICENCGSRGLDFSFEQFGDRLFVCKFCLNRETFCADGKRKENPIKYL